MSYINNPTEFEEKYSELDIYVKAELSEKRYKHTISVVGEAKRLADLNQMTVEDTRRVMLAAIFHDAAKELSDDQMTRLIEKYQLDEKYLGNSNLAHGKLASKMITDLFGIDDQDIVNGISFHTTGRENMSQVEKVVFIADAIEPLRNYDVVDEIRKTTWNNLDKGCHKMLVETIKMLEKKSKGPIDEDTILAEQWFRKFV